MNSKVGRRALIVIGVIALAVGGVWIGQGFNIIPGSFMTGDRTWAVIGVIVAAVGVILLMFGVRRRTDGSSDR